MAKPKLQSVLTNTKELDPFLAALFSGSAGPVYVPRQTSYAEQLPRKRQDVTKPPHHNEADDSAWGLSGEDMCEVSGDNDSEDADSSAEYMKDIDSDESEGNQEHLDADEILKIVDQGANSAKEGRKRKRTKRNENDNLEARHLDQLRDDDYESSGKRQKTGDVIENLAFAPRPEESGEERKDDESASSNSEIPVHENLAKEKAPTELEKAQCTAFLSNVSIDCVTSSKAKRQLLAHLSSVLDKSTSPPQTLDSIRFRSTAFSIMAIPKRASFIKKEIMDATTKSTNAYVVYSSPAAVRMAVNKLNGTVVLDRHLRVDSVAHPAAQDHKRCVFVGNLGFVNDETVLNIKMDEEGKETTKKRKRTKQPMDVEEGLWRVFNSQAGKVESVRVVRDKVTRVGKGFAYVQFYDGNDVESALLLAGKKFPPMLPRQLRVTRCKAPQKTIRALEARKSKMNGDEEAGRIGSNGYVPKPTGKDQSLEGRAEKLLGRAGAYHMSRSPKVDKARSPKQASKADKPEDKDMGHRRIRGREEIVFEGRRASSKDGKPKDFKFKSRKSGISGAKKKRSSRAVDRSSKWKAARKRGV